jgi:hypothetical protein
MAQGYVQTPCKLNETAIGNVVAIGEKPPFMSHPAIVVAFFGNYRPTLSVEGL